ncbi:MAG TPA: GGDEF domain-containing protein [Clostridia bacterium]|nr:GGDEF domain-containing protein [Clostridia bacterium]
MINRAGRYDITFFAEFADKVLEKEFLQHDMKYFSRFMGRVALIFGALNLSFGISDYFAFKSSSPFMVILLIRVLFLGTSIGVYYAVRKIVDYSSLVQLVTAYEIGFLISFMVILYIYGSLGLIAFFSIMAITLAIYITPNKLINAQILSILFNLSFFILYANHIEHLRTGVLLKMIGYSLIFILFGNIEAYLTNVYRRRQFADRRELARLSITDSLTGIYNRVKSDQDLNWWIDYCNRYGNPFSMVILDIDDFKKLNDQYGHLVGDSVLQSIVSSLKNVIRSTDVFARWGGDEFVILLPNTDLLQAMDITERMRISIQETQYEEVGKVTCSFGLVSLQKDENTQSLLRRADQFLYKAKDQGKNIIAC